MRRGAASVDTVPGRHADRTADTRVPIHPDIAARWSPRMFDPAAEVTGEQITAIAFFQDSRTVYFLLADAGAPFQSLSTSLQFESTSSPQVLS